MSHTSARIRSVTPDRIRREIDQKKIVVVCGFQGLSRYDDITTLGRGGSDTSAVAIAAAMHADLCQIYTDVEGVYTADPRKVPNAKKLPAISYDEMLELATLGAQVLNNRSVEMAKKYNIELEVLSSYTNTPGYHRKGEGKNGKNVNQRRSQGYRRSPPLCHLCSRPSRHGLQTLLEAGSEEDQR